LLDQWDPKLAKKVLTGVKPLISPAYIIRSPHGFNKVDGLIQVLTPIWKAQQAGKLDFKGTTLEEAHTRLREFYCVGSFMAYEAVSDLQHTPVLNKASDTMTWAAAGPGAARGLARILGEDLRRFHYSNKKGQAEMLPLMQELLAASKKPSNWTDGWHLWDMRNVEHWLCEMDKYQRVFLGQGEPKQRYNGI